MSEKEIRKANRRALPGFLLMLVVCVAVGGGIGYLFGKYRLDTLAGGLKRACAFFGGQIAPWLLLALDVIVPAVAVPAYRGVKKRLSAWDGEDEEASDAMDARLSEILWFAGSAMIVSYFLIAASYSIGIAALDDRGNALRFALAIVGLIAVLVETLLIQQRCVDAAKILNPEKTASVYDMRFQKKWMDSCDEAEKVLIGQCAYKAFGATNIACLALTILLVAGALVFDIGFVPSLVVCVIWLVNQSVYCREGIRSSRAGNRIS